MNKRLIRLTESDLHKVIKESVRRILTETYRGMLYHFTTLPNLYTILKQNALISDYTDDFCDYRKGTYDNEYDEKKHCLCFTRDKTYNIRECGVSCCLVFDAEKLMNIRNAKLYPVNWSMEPKFNKYNEAEERLWGVNVYPLDKYVERIDIVISDLSDFDDAGSDLTYDFLDKYEDSYYAKYPNGEGLYEFIGKKMLNGILRMKRFKGKINVRKVNC